MHTIKEWKHPKNYMGATWEGWYSAGFGQSRDSDTLKESNFAVASRELMALSDAVTVREEISNGQEDECTSVRIVREGHWAVGWVEWIAIHKSNAAALELAKELCDRANNYPILDESDFTEREWSKATEYWEQEPIKYRLDWLKRYEPGIPCFAARHDLSTIMHDYDADYLWQALTND